MRFGLTTDQAAMRDAVRELLDRECPPATVRAAWSGGDPRRVARLWSHLAELGMPGAGVPAQSGGAGLCETDLYPLLVELGYAAVPLPVAETAAVAGPLLAAAGDPGGQVGRLVAGSARVALVGPTGLAPYGDRADLLIGIDPHRATLVPRDAVTATVAPTVDGSRAVLRVAELHTTGRPVSTDPDLLALTLDRAALATAAQLVGLCRRLLDLTVRYVTQRRQFGVPVGSFQAVKHQLADVTLRLELAASTTMRAAWSTATDPSAREPDVSAAYVLATEAAALASRTALQCHGAIGYTVEHDLHLYAKRVWALTAAGGGVDRHLERLATALDLPEAAV